MEGHNRPNDEYNQPVSAPLLRENDELELTITQNGSADCSGFMPTGNNVGADCSSFPYISLPVDLSTRENMRLTNQSWTYDIPETGGNMMADFMRVNALQNPQIDPCSMSNRNNTPINFSHPQISFPEPNMRLMYQSINHDHMLPPGNVMMDGGTGYSCFQNPHVNRNLMLPRGTASGGFQMARHGEANSSNINSPQLRGNFVRSGGSPPILYHTQNRGYAQTHNTVEVNSDQLGCTENFDGSFLSLGIGDKSEARSKSKFSTREIASKLEEAHSSNLNSSHVQQTTRSSSSLGPNLVASFPSFQSNASGFSSPACNASGWTSSKNDVGIIRGSKNGINLNQFHNLQEQQVDMQHNISMLSNKSSGFVRDARYSNLHPYQGYTSDQATSSGGNCSSSSGFHSSGQIGISGLASESANSTWITTQTTSDQFQKCYMKTPKNFSSESPTSFPFLGFKGSSTSQDHSGPVFTAMEGSPTQAAENRLIPRRIGAQQAGQLFSAHDNSATQAGPHPFRNLVGVHVTEGSAAQATTDNLFPKRMGFQAKEGTAARGNLFPNGMGVQTASNLHRPHNSGTIQFPRIFPRPSFANGPSQGSVPSQSSANCRGPFPTTGQLQGSVPLHCLLRPVATAGQSIPVATVNGHAQSSSDFVGRQSLKRGAIRPPPAARWVQRRKITQPIIRPSMPYPSQTALPPIPIPAGHVKWQGCDEPPQPTGQRCLLCKRDLSFAPDGLVHQPTVPPAVAVLPCGHTFHDHCLQIITPHDQSKDPPCIPCAIGDN